MSDEIVFYHNPRSRGRVVHWALEECGAPYRIELLSFEKRDHKRTDYVALNPMGKIPAIVHRGVVVTEVGAICTYLADAFPNAGLAPALDDPRRGSYLRWMFFGAGCVDPAMVDRMLSRPPVEPRGRSGYGSFDEVMTALETAISPGPFILGERFSMADVYIASMIQWGLMTQTLGERPALIEYATRASDRPAFRRSNEASAELVRQLESGS